MCCLCGFVHALFVASWCQYSPHDCGFIHVIGTLQLVIRNTQQSSGCVASADSFMLYSSPVGVNNLFMIAVSFMLSGPSNSLSGMHNKAHELPLRIHSCFIHHQLVSIISS